MKKTNVFQERKQAKKEKSFFVSVFLGSMITFVSGITLLFISAFPALLLDDPFRYAPVFAIVSLFIAVIIGGYSAAHIHRKSGLACGALSSLFTIGALVIFAFAFGLKIQTMLFAICAPTLIIFASIAGVCGVSTERTAKPKHKIKF